MTMYMSHFIKAGNHWSTHHRMGKADLKNTWMITVLSVLFNKSEIQGKSMFYGDQ